MTRHSVVLGSMLAAAALAAVAAPYAAAVSISGVTKSGADAGNYSITQPTTTADITALFEAAY